MVRLLIEDVTLTRHRHVAVQVRFKGGQTTGVEVPVALPAPEARRTPAEVIAEIDRLFDDFTEAGVAEQLNRQGVRSGTDQPFTRGMIRHLRIKYGLATREQRLRARGLVSLHEVAARPGAAPKTVKDWRREGRLVGELINDKGERFFQVPDVVPRKAIGRPPGTKNRPKQTTAGTNTGGAV